MAAVVRALHDQLPRNSVERAMCALANAVAASVLNRSTAAGGLAVATIPARVKSVNTITYTVGGAFFSKVATDSLWILTGATVPINAWNKYLLLLDTALAASVIEGTASNISAAAVTFAGDPFGWSAIVNAANSTPGRTIVGSVTVATSTAPFIPGTTSLAAAGLTVTFFDGLDPSALPLVGNEQLVPIVLL